MSRFLFVCFLLLLLFSHAPLLEAKESHVFCPRGRSHLLTAERFGVSRVFKVAERFRSLRAPSILVAGSQHSPRLLCF